MLNGKMEWTKNKNKYNLCNRIEMTAINSEQRTAKISYFYEWIEYNI